MFNGGQRIAGRLSSLFGDHAMWVHLKNGRSFYFRDAKTIDDNDGDVNIYGNRNKWIATFKSDAVACYFREGVDVEEVSE